MCTSAFTYDFRTGERLICEVSGKHSRSFGGEEQHFARKFGVSWYWRDRDADESSD